MKLQQAPTQQDLVLIGGGHSHAIVLQMWGMNPLPGVRLILISDGSDTPYSGMLPGHVAGFYTREECHIDLRSLCQFAGAIFYGDRAVGLDLQQKQVLCANRPPVGFDYLSIDIGSTPEVEFSGAQTSNVVRFAPSGPNISNVGGFDDWQSTLPPNTVPAKPVPQFLQWWNDLCAQLTQNPHQAVKLAIVGGGVGGVELAVNMQRRLSQLVTSAPYELHLFSRSPIVLPQQSAWVQRYFQNLLDDRGVSVHLDATVTDWDGQTLQIQTGEQFQFDATVWVTQATAPDWLAQSGLAVDDRGFIQVDQHLRSTSHPAVFAAGDIATMVQQPRPKAGVFAVRQGKPLRENLRRSLLGEPLREFVPQRRYLSLIGTGDGHAVAAWGKLGIKLPFLWAWKDHIDRKFMQRFEPAILAAKMADNSGERSLDVDALPIATPHRGMRCSGCGAKVGSSVLSRALERLAIDAHPDDPTVPILGLAQPDDAAVLPVPADQLLVQTVDYFPAIVDDPYLFGQIATNHALSDLFAMGATASSVLAIVTLPYASEAKQEETLFQLLSGALDTLRMTQTQLVGGHTIEGEKLMFGLTANGFVTPDQLLKKSGMQPGDVLILTKPIGTGTIFAAQMRYAAKPAWIDGAIAAMLQSNYPASQTFLAHGATACTDITGFGLLGHLLEMLRGTDRRAKLQIEQIPFIQGAVETTAQGIVSSLYPQNQRAQNWIANLAAIAHHPYFPLLFDPQTAGGLLATVPPDRAADCLRTLQQSGHTAQIIGQIHTPLDKEPLPITIE